MKTSKLFLTSLLAAAMSATAYATDVPTGTVTTVTSLETTNNIAEGGALFLNTNTNNAQESWTITAGITTTATTSFDYAWFGSGTAPKNKDLNFSGATLSGSGDLGIVGTSGGRDFTVTLSALNAASNLSGKLTVINTFDKNTTVNIGGTTLQGAEFVFGAEISTADGYRYGSGSGSYLLKLSSAASLAGISGTSSEKASRESVTVTTAGTVFTLAGTGVYEFYGSVGTSDKAVGISKTGTGTQTLGGTIYLGDLSVTGGTLALSGTANIAGTTTVGNGATLDLSGGTITLASAIANSGTVTVSEGTVFNFTDSFKDGDVYTLVSGGTISGWDSLTSSNFTYNGAAITVGRQLTSSAAGVVSYNTSATAKTLTWNGGSSAVWKLVTITETSPAKPWQDGNTAEAFYQGDSVTFATEGAQVSVEGTVVPAALTISAATTFTGTGTVNIAAANLTTTAALTLGENVVLDLGSISAATNKTISGTGTVKVVSSSTNNNGTPDHNGTLTLGSGFSGTIEYSGKFDTSNGTNNPNAKFALSNGSMWGGGTIRNDIHFLTNYQLGDSSATTIVLNGNLTQEAGTTLTIGTAADTNITFGGSATIGTLNQTAGTLTISGATTVTGNYQGSSGDNASSVLTVSEGGSLSVDGNFTLRYQNNNATGATMYVSGDVSVGGNFWIARDGKGIVNINDGGTVVANTLTFGQRWADSAGTSKTSQVNVAEGGKLIAGSIVANTDRNSASDVDILKSSALNLNGGTLGTSADSMTIDVTSGSTALSVVLGTETTSTINTGKYDTSTKTFTDTGAAISIANVISGDGALKKAGAGMLTLSNANTYKGGTVIEAGTVVAANANALGTTKGVEVQSGATLNLGASAVTVAGLSGAGTVGLADGTTSSTLTVNSDTDSTFSGSIGGEAGAAISLVKQGAGTLELSGDNIMLVYPPIVGFAPGVDVQAGTVRVVQTGSNNQVFANVSVADDATLELSTVSESIAVNATSVVLSSSAKILVDMSNYASDADVVAVNLISASALSYAGTTINAGNVDTLLGAIELKNWGDGWTQSLSYANNTLSLTLTIPEPSVFGLLAGLGALALAGTRRRRRKA